MDVTEQAPGPPPPPAASRRPRNGLGVAALVIGVASLVAAISFVLFPLALLGGLVGLILGIIALTRGNDKGATNTGQAIAGVVCSALALIISIVLTVRVGTWAASNSDVFARFDKCIAQAADRADVSTCIARFANDVRP
jgi:membrane-bound ClpP family serine protease